MLHISICCQHPYTLVSSAHLLALGDVDLHELVYSFFKVELYVSSDLHRTDE